MKKLMVAIAGAVALTCSAFADATTWFDGGVAAGFPNDASMTGGAWDDAASTKAAWDSTKSALIVEAETNAPLVFTATEAKAVGDTVKSFEISATITFTPFETLPEIPADAKAGMIIAASKYYGIGKVDEAAAWVELGAATDVDQAKAITVTRNADGLVYAVDGTAFTAVTPVSDAAFQCVNMSGDGELAALSATYEANVVDFTIAAIANTEIIAVTNNGVEITGPTYQAVKGSEVIVTYRTLPGYLFSDGSNVKQGTGTADAGEITTDVTAEDVEKAKFDINGTQYYLTFAAAKTALKTGDTVTFLEDASLTADESNLFIANLDYTLDFGGNTITLTEEFNFGKEQTGNVVITNGTIQLAADYAMMVRSYGASVTIADVTIDATHLIVNTKKSPDAYAGAITITAGSLTLAGNTQVINVPAGLNGVAFNNYASAVSYTLETFDVTGLTGTIGGNVLITGGAVKGAKAEMFEGDVNVGAGGGSYLTSLAGSGFAALAGEFATEYTASAYLTNVTGKAYFTVADAFANATDKVTIADDCEVAARINIDATKSVTLDANGKTITIAKDTYAFVYGGADTAKGNGTMTVTGNGTFQIKDGDADANGIILWARYGNMVVTNGTFTMSGSGEVAFARNGCTIDIYGGTMKNLTANGDVLNVANEESVTQIQCYGGSYSKDPSFGDDYIGPTFVAEGCFAEANAEFFTVYSQAVAEAKIGDKFFTTLAKAFAAAEDGDTIVLQKNIDVAERINIDATKSVTFDANGKTITIAKDTYAFVYGGADTAKGNGTMTVTGNGTFQIKDGDADANGIILWARYGNMVVTNGTFTMSGSGEVAFARNGCTIDIYGGTMKNLTANGDVLNVANEESVTQIQCYGGSYSKDPSFGDDYIGPTFVAEGYESKLNGETGLYDVTKKTSGPTPGAGSETKVTPVPGEENTYKVEPTGSGTTVVVDNVKEGDTLVVDATVTAIGVQEGEQSGVIIKVMNSGNTAEIPNDAMVGWNGNKFETALDPDKTVDVTTEAGTVEVPVTPTLIEETATEKPLVVGDNVETTVQAIPGLTYKLIRDDAPGGTFETTADSDVGKDGQATITLTDSNKPETKAFYKIQVTK